MEIIYKAWMQKLEQLKAFKDREGHLRVPKDNDTLPLNRWMTDQRCFQKKPVGHPRALTPMKFKLLDDIGFPWENQQPWNLACKIGTENKKDTTSPKKKSRTISKKKSTKMVKKKTTKQQQIGNRTVGAMPHAKWMARYNMLCNFKKKNGHLQVSVPVGDKMYPLVRWIYKMRSSAKSNTLVNCLTPEKKRLLDEIGFDWVGGSQNVTNQPSNPSRARSQFTSGRRQMVTGPKHKSGMITKKKQGTKIPSQKVPTMAKKKKQQQIGNRTVGAMPNAAWMAKYKMLCDFKKEHGHLQVSAKIGHKMYPLVKFIYHMRSYAKPSTKYAPLTPEKKRLLDEIGFDWVGGQLSKSRPQFISAQRQMVTGPKHKSGTIIKKKQGTKIPTQKVPTMAKKKKKNKQQIANHTVIGPMPNAAWMAKYKMLCDFKKEHGHLRVCAPVGDKMYPLVRFIYFVRSCARPNTKYDPLTPEKKRLLNELGFDWFGGQNVTNQPSSRRAPRVVTTKVSRPRIAKSSGSTRFASVNPFVSETNASRRLTIGGAIVTQINVESTKKDTKPAQQSFLSLWAGSRTITLSTSDMDVQLKPELNFDRRTYSLVCRKVKKESTFDNFRKTRIDLTYVATKGPGLSEWNLQQELEKIADFRSLTRTKAVARLELLQTPGNSTHVWHLTANDFEIMSPEEECFHQGCSYIPEAFARKLASNTAVADRTESYQVRIFGPKLGAAKGMLMKTKGGDKIRIAPSLLKTLPSRKSKSKWVVMIAKGVYPTSPNINHGKYIDPNNAGGPPKSFEKNQPKRLSDMYCTLFKGLGVPGKLLGDYKKGAKAGLKGLRHGHFRGVRDPNGDDPNGKLPEGTIMLSGFQMDCNGDLGDDFLLNVKKVLVTRSPCLEPSDAKILEVITKKPKKMSQQKWQDLCDSLSQFGHIVFSVPDKSNKKSVPLPTIVGEGDLDGDDYFVCWDEKIVEALGPKTAAGRRMKRDEEEQRKRRPRYDNRTQGPTFRKGSSTWLKEAQDLMLDFSMVKNFNKITGTLFTLSNKIAEESDEGIYDPDARAVARAFKDSLDTMKHGGVVELPSHLREKITASLQDCFHWV